MAASTAASSSSATAAEDGDEKNLPMKRAARSLLNILTAASVYLLIACVANLKVHWQDKYFYYYRFITPPVPAAEAYRAAAFRGAPAQLHILLGFRWGVTMLIAPEGYGRARFLDIPIGYAILLGLALPSARLWLAMTHRRRRKRSQQLGLCPHCGYDLRATPDQCPECGRIPPKTELISN
jgi:hypothetical protein